MPGDPAATTGDRRLRELLGDPQQWVRRAFHYLDGDLHHPLAPGSRRSPEQLEGLPGPEPVAFSQDPDRLLDPHPGGQRVFQLGHGDLEPLRIEGLVTGNGARTVDPSGATVGTAAPGGAASECTG